MEYKETYVRNLLPQRPAISNKGTYGHVLNIAGSAYYTGAAYFSSISPLLVGAGKSTLATTPSAINKIASFSPDIIYYPLIETNKGLISPKSIEYISAKLSQVNALSIGCGLSVDKDTSKLLQNLLRLDIKIPTVIDADGLNILAKLNENLPAKTILTPHPLELARLMDIEVNTILQNPKLILKKAVKKYECTIILKLHNTLILTPDEKFYVNKTGNSALSHGGSGDVLCGMLTGFLAQGLDCFDASCLAVYLHGLASELASADLTEYSATTSKLLNYIPKAIKTLI